MHRPISRGKADYKTPRLNLLQGAIRAWPSKYLSVLLAQLRAEIGEAKGRGKLYLLPALVMALRAKSDEAKLQAIHSIDDLGAYSAIEGLFEGLRSESNDVVYYSLCGLLKRARRFGQRKSSIFKMLLQFDLASNADPGVAKKYRELRETLASAFQEGNACSD
jgi:hypothetical protein